MEPFRYHLFVCTQEKAEGVPCCSASGSPQVLEALHRELGVRGLSNDVQVSSCGCLGLCEDGPVVIVYPDGMWYAPVKAEDAGELVASHLQQGKIVERLARRDSEAMKAHILEHRDRYVAMMKARDAAGILPDNLNEMARGFMPSRVLLTALTLDVFTAVGSSASVKDVARRIHADERATEMLLNALVSLKLLEKSEGLYRDTPATARFFTQQSPDNARPGLMHTVNLWHRWSTLTEAVREGTAVESRVRDAESTQSFIAAMDRNARERAAAVVDAAGTNGSRRLLDLGGGSAAYSIAFARAIPGLTADVLDVPEVVPLTREYIRKAGLAERIRTIPGDMLATELGSGYDLVLISAICHMFSPEENRRLLRRAYAALTPNGRIVVQDFILEPDKTSPRFAALFALNMLVGTRAGSSYSEPEYSEWLREAGFRDIKRVRLPGPAGLMIATK